MISRNRTLAILRPDGEVPRLHLVHAADGDVVVLYFAVAIPRNLINSTIDRAPERLARTVDAGEDALDP